MNLSIDALSFTDASSACLEAFRRASKTSEGPIERHSARVFFIMEQLARQARVGIDLELSACAAVLHDVGLYDPAARPRLYLRDGRVAAESVIASFAWDEKRKKRCLDAIELHHRLTAQWEAGAEVEFLRLADLVDASRGLVSLGIDRNWLRLLFRSISRSGLQRELLRHAIRGAPCMTRGLLGTLMNAPRRTIHGRRISTS